MDINSLLLLKKNRNIWEILSTLRLKINDINNWYYIVAITNENLHTHIINNVWQISDFLRFCNVFLILFFLLLIFSYNEIIMIGINEGLILYCFFWTICFKIYIYNYFFNVYYYFKNFWCSYGLVIWIESEIRKIQLFSQNVIFNVDCIWHIMENENNYCDWMYSVVDKQMPEFCKFIHIYSHHANYVNMLDRFTHLTKHIHTNCPPP